jgi:hypothetical protein
LSRGKFLKAGDSALLFYFFFIKNGTVEHKCLKSLLLFNRQLKILPFPPSQLLTFITSFFSHSHNLDKPEPKRLLFTAEYAEYAERFFIFYYKRFLICDLCAFCGEKNIMPKRGFLARHLIFPNIINASGGFWHPRACFFFSNRLTY